MNGRDMHVSSPLLVRAGGYMDSRFRGNDSGGMDGSLGGLAFCIDKSNEKEYNRF